MYLNGSIKEYLDDLAARKPAPGGGSASALSAAVGVSLMSMVANYTIGNKKYQSDEKEISSLLVELDKFASELQGLVDKDVEAYSALSKKMKELDKDSPALDEAFKSAMKVPFEVCKISAETLRLCKTLAERGNKNLITDTAIAAILLEGAFFSAKYNVYINMKYIKDINFVGEVHKILVSLEEEMPKLKEDILEACEDVISK